jgi:hypothetical protein
MTETDYDMPADQLLPAYLVKVELRLAASSEETTNGGRPAVLLEVPEF